MSKKHTPSAGLKRIWKALFYSIAGIKTALKNEAAFRQDCALVISLIAIALYVEDFGAARCAWVIAAGFILLITEILNSAMEWTVDLACRGEISDLAKGAKDMGSAAVFFALCHLLLAFSATVLGALL